MTSAAETIERINAASIACVEKTNKPPRVVYVGPDAMVGLIAHQGMFAKFAGARPVTLLMETAAGEVPVAVRPALHEAVIAEGQNWGEPFIEDGSQ